MVACTGPQLHARPVKNVGSAPADGWKQAITSSIRTCSRRFTNRPLHSLSSILTPPQILLTWNSI